MIGKVSLAQLAQAIDAELIGNDAPVSGSICIDSRSLEKGQIFVALSGIHVDGHVYAAFAFEAGAVACVVEKKQTVSGAQLIVNDARKALLQLGRFNRNRFNGLLVGLTGSCGKTSVKEMLAAIFTQAAPTLATQGNLNNDLGMPMTLSRLTSEHALAVIEMGTSGPGEIGLLTQIAQPQISIITNAEAAHLEGLISVEGVAQEKGAILDSLPVDGTAILNRDSRFFSEWQERAGKRQAETISFSLANEEADVYASDIIHKKDGSDFTLHCLGKSLPVSLAFWGAHQVMNACTAAAAAIAAGISPEIIVKGLHEVKPYERRGKRFIGAKGALIIDESYNANPASTRAAIDMLAACQGRRIFVMGDMGELAAERERAHRDMGSYARQKGIEQLITYGESSQLAAESFGSEAVPFLDKALLNNYLYTHLSPRATVLVKGSNGMKMNEIVHYCRADSNCATENDDSVSAISRNCIEDSVRGL